jgi:hypothetical protein
MSVHRNALKIIGEREMNEDVTKLPVTLRRYRVDPLGKILGAGGKRFAPLLGLLLELSRELNQISGLAPTLCHKGGPGITDSAEPTVLEKWVVGRERCPRPRPNRANQLPFRCRSHIRLKQRQHVQNLGHQLRHFGRASGELLLQFFEEANPRRVNRISDKRLNQLSNVTRRPKRPGRKQ